MSLKPIWHQLQLVFQSLSWIVGLSVVFLVVMGWSIPVQAATTSIRDSVNQDLNLTVTSLEAQVLQIIRNHPEVILESLQAYHEEKQEQQEKSRQVLFQQLKTDPETVIGISPSTGAVDRNVVLLEFSDFQCPYCREAYKTLKQFKTNHPDEVTLVYKHLPLPAIHPEAIKAAKAAWAAGQQGKFWSYHDALFSHQDQLSETFYVYVAKSLNLDLTKFNQDRNAREASDAIQQDIEMAKTLGIKGTPFFIMNGELLAGAVPLSNLEEALQKVNLAN